MVCFLMTGTYLSTLQNVTLHYLQQSLKYSRLENHLMDSEMSFKNFLAKF